MRPELLKQVRLCIACALIASLLVGCSPFKKGHTVSKYPLNNSEWGMDRDTSRWFSWNILFKDATPRSQADAAINAIEQQVQDAVTRFNPDWKALFWIYRCKCDTSLLNLAAKVVDGQDRAVTPPGGITPTGGGGDILFVSENHELQKDRETKDSLRRGKVAVSRSAKHSDKIFAIIDTGIDPSCFTPELTGLIWKAPPGKLALYNFLGGSYGDLDNYDDHGKKHGSGVAAVSIMAMDGGVYPKLMILKALDKYKRGTTFTFSCALSYAIQNNADVVNASLGYEGKSSEADPILFNYLRKARDTVPDKPIYIFTAAGNIDVTGSLCDAGAPTNELRGARMFFPGCFSTSLNNVINVTGLTKDDQSCRFQNYSSTFVTLGVLNNPGCCLYRTPFFSFSFDGTSFATPAAAGMVMNMHLSPTGQSIPSCITALQQTSPSSNPVTVGGHYFNYTHN